MQRWKLTLEYDGRPFVGWQRQDNGPSVQQALEEAIYRFTQETVTVFCAGRTDAGVHALAMVASVDLAREATADKVQAALNFHLKPHPVAVLRVEPVAPDFHARFSCLGRAYLYRILNRRAPAALEAGRVWHVQGGLDAEAMHEAAQRLVGQHDFSSFRASLCQAKSPVKTLSDLSVARVGEEVRIVARARSFLHHQVRNMVGTLKLVGEGRWTADDVSRALAARNRSAAGPTAPAAGLYFTEAWY
ncbi:tRNA pseudouridine(38-40) synthase TruA [Rhodospirillum centenum]|uniref:tRNA pseudouridine synthase A n=1 Tax=Rhodospirillum centenum (strain ATCC 51521 / SW) TaxID=414684 RepID=TRUA_RHOCS|nr:tRNA pseudouridine(38-40) synthase TruA [Rhodospirillum centenum]B6IPI0.1 RecName: Full=tRNA pseudouridine synthase A; AltName: Full=tRNA pseudouridine(38-40) synthase; AltName: Full=tRNA pseudouridylate synthase I; AltName: Full=tRNA-uridine isomerase I [Rhodospirillum centenum SW]ACI99682.1 tRNA pseudouridine synthase A [Rhodospirillum centenum SW]